MIAPSQLVLKIQTPQRLLNGITAQDMNSEWLTAIIKVN